MIVRKKYNAYIETQVVTYGSKKVTLLKFYKHTNI